MTRHSSADCKLTFRDSVFRLRIICEVIENFY